SPFFIGELAQYALMQTAAVSVPTHIDMTIDNVVSARIGQLPEEGRRLLEIVAVSGKPLPRALAKQAAKIIADEQMLIILRAGHLLRSTAKTDYEEIDTYHDRIREAVLAKLPETALKDYHHQLAMILESHHSDDPESLAIHFQQGGDREKAYHY